MYIIYYHPICPFSRQIRVAFKELSLNFSLEKVDYWKMDISFEKLNPASVLPMIIAEKPTNISLIGIYPSIEYLFDTMTDDHFFSSNIQEMAEVRKLLSWFNDKFYREVSKILIDEKIIRLLGNMGYPRTDFIQIAKSNASNHFRFMSDILKNRSYIASEQFSMVDIAAASHISIIDYLGEINWDNWPLLRHWYSLIKSRPSFRPILQDVIAGFSPPKEYQDLDF